MKTFKNAVLIMAVVSPLVTGCQKDPDMAGAEIDSGDAEPVEVAQDDLFAGSRMLALRIEVAPDQMKTLNANEDSHDYVSCTVREAELRWNEAGLRCRGNPAKELATGKPDLIVTFDKFVSGQRFHGQRRVVLQASREDPSYVATPIAFEMFQEAGVPAPRCGFARVELNGRDLGVYVLIEGVEREFIERNFHKTSGNLYDEGSSRDITSKLEKARGADRNDQSDVDALAAAAAQADPAARWRGLQQRLDVDRFVAFTALEVLLWQDDSYALEARKFRLYHDPDSDLMIFFPKNVERVLEKTDGPILPECRGIVARAVLTTPEGRQRYCETISNLLVNVFNPAKVETRANKLAGTIRPVLASGNAAAAQSFDAALTNFLSAVNRRAESAAAQLKQVPITQ
jgi:spore coat protein CotH